MKRIKYIFPLLSILLLGSCSVKKNISSTQAVEFDTLEYYSVFTDATKHALLDNYRPAVKLFNHTIKINPQAAASYYQLSSIYLKTNNYSYAQAFAEKAVALDSLNYWYLVHLANIYQYGNNIDQAISCYEKIVALNKSVEDKYKLALLYTAGNKQQLALNLSEELRKDNIGSRELFIMRHNIYHSMSNYDSAVYELENLIEFYPDDFENYGLLAEYLREIHRNTYAQQVYRKLLNIEPDNGLVNISYAEYLFTTGKIDSAYHYYTIGFKSSDITEENKLNMLFNLVSSIETRPADSIYIGELIQSVKDDYSSGKIYSLSADYNIKLKHYDLAIEDLTEYIKIDPKNEFIWEQKLMILNFIDRHEDVISASDSALSYFDKGSYYLIKAYSLFSLKKYKELIIVCDSGVVKDTIKSDIIQFHNLRADAYRELGDNTNSDKYYDLILELDPGNLMIRNNYSYYLSVRSERLEYAEELSRLTIKLEPNNATYLDTYGWILYKLGKFKEAKKYVELAIRNGAYQNVEVLDHYGDIMFSLGSCKEAIEAWKEAIKLDLENTRLFNKIADAQESCE